MQPMVDNDCWGVLTEQRIASLKFELCEGGGVCDASHLFDPPRRRRPR